MTWLFELHKGGLTEGMRFKVDVIDTWNMTITPVEGDFVTKKKDNYSFGDASGRSVALPGKAGIAIRAVRIGGATTLPSPPNGE